MGFSQMKRSLLWTVRMVDRLIGMIWEKRNRFFPKRPFRRRSLMIWGAFSSNVKAKLIEMKVKQNTTKYTEILENSLLPFIHLYEEDEVIFQPDNVTIHTARHAKIWFTSQNTNVLNWSVKFPGLNVIENLNRDLWRLAYQNGRQFNDKNSLIECFKKYWDEISLETFLLI